MNKYEEKRQAKIERLRAGAVAAAARSEAAYDQAHKMADVIPFGEPIHVGHYSEGRDRRYRGRIESTYRKAGADADLSKTLERRAKNMASDRTISGDDPDVVVKLEARIAKLTADQAQYVAINKLVKKGDVAGLLALGRGLDEATVAKLFVPDFAGRIGIPDYVLTNNRANIRRLQDRLVIAKKKTEMVAVEVETAGVRRVVNVEDNRLQLFFPGKPSETVRGYLKARGFHWTPSVGCWQRQLSESASYAADQVLAAIAAEEQ